MRILGTTAIPAFLPLFLVLLAGGLGLPAGAFAAKDIRIALVIGNSDYEAAPLANPVNDARLMASTLRSLGFEVLERLDVNQKDMKRAINDFGDRLERAGDDGVGLFYYAGHGVQVNGQNYLIPVDANIRREKDVDVEGVNASTVIGAMDFARNRINFVIMDACRNNPYSRSFRSSTTGLARMDAPRGMLVAYATGPGDVAADGDGVNSPYTKALAETMRQPGLSVERMFREVRNKVMGKTNEFQIPWEASSLTGGDFYFNSGETEIAMVTPENKLAAFTRGDTKFPASPKREIQEIARLQPAEPEPRSRSFQVNYVFRHLETAPFRPLADGAVLRSGDRYKIIFTPDEDSYVYIFQADSAGQLFQLFPMESFKGVRLGNNNPVEKGKTYFLPAQDKAFKLDRKTGRERFYFIAAGRRNPELENLYGELTRARSVNDKTRALSSESKLNRLFTKRSVSATARDKASEVSWKEQEEVFSIVEQRLEKLCEDCVNTVEFVHQ